jgi:hypothetical protein
MQFKPQQLKISDLLQSFDAGLLIRNPEYQRGATWDIVQQKGLIDSVFRRYPIPPLFLFKKSFRGLDGGVSDKFEIVDGQQRLIALSHFRKDQFPLFQLTDPKFKIPNSLRALPRPWAGKLFGDLSEELKTYFEDFALDVQMIENVENSDEIRDLFIRLQAGTALTPQQVRDAWPGNIGPFIERLAGKMNHKPSLQLFELIDRRGSRSDDDDQTDPYVDHRSTCAQLLRTYLARGSDPLNFVSISSKHLDALYHENPEFDPAGPTATAFKAAMELAQDVLRLASESEPEPAAQKKRKFRKVDVICLLAYLQDIQTSATLKVDVAAKHKFAAFLLNYGGGTGGKTTSGASLAENYSIFLKSLPPDLLIRTDPKRLFDDDQKREIKIRQDGRCQICKEPVLDGDAEYDHFPISYGRGGKTVVENGRLVCKRCHPRYGRPTNDTI